MTADWPTLVNGTPGDAVPVSNRGLAYGDGLFETMLVHGGEILLLERHLERLRWGCERLDLAPDIEALTSLIRRFADSLADRGWCVVKLILTRRNDARGYRPQTSVCDSILTAAAAETPWQVRQWRDGACVAALDSCCAPNPALSGIKHLNRIEQVLAAAEVAQRGLDEGVLTDGAGNIVGCTAASLIYRCDNRLVQVHHPACGVDGTMASHLGLISRSAGLGSVEKRQATVAELAEATEVFCCNAIRGIWPIIELDGRTLQIGEATRILQTRLQSELTS